MNPEIITRLRADAEVADMRRAERGGSSGNITRLRPPHIRPWGIAAGASPVCRSSNRVGWWLIAAGAAVVACAFLMTIGVGR